MKKLLLILLTFTISTLAQVENSAGKYPLKSNPLFYYDVADYRGSTDSLTRVDIFLKVPYLRIKFIKRGNIYEANYDVDLSFFDSEADTLMLHRSWREDVKTKDFRATTMPSSFNLSYRSFNLLPGIYKLKISVQDDNSQIKGSSENPVTVLPINKPLDISDIVLISKMVGNGKKEKIIPNVSKVITSKVRSISFFYVVYSNIPRDVTIFYQVTNLRKDKFYKQSVNKKIKIGKNVIYQTLKNEELTLGEYSLIVKVIDDSTGQKIGIGKKFYSKISNFPTSIVDLDLAIDQMIYIASASQIDYIKSAKTYDEKLRRYLRFWKSKDPSPNTPENEVLDEYYRRVDYANANFKSYYDGWRTDMGMIYITLGPPDQVERHPFEYDSKPYEIWDYYTLNRRFIFVDETGFGDYRLVNPDFNDWRYRY